jgi:iron complex outermembrane receptor protein
MGVSRGRATVTGSTFKGGQSGIESDGFINVPLPTTLAGRFAYSVKSIGGYQHNLITDNYLANNKVSSYRASLRWQPNEKWNILASGSYLRRVGSGDGPTIVGDGALAASIRDRTQGDLHKVLLDDDGFTRRTIGTALVNASYETPVGQISPITGYRYLNHGSRKTPMAAPIASTSRRSTRMTNGRSARNFGSPQTSAVLSILWLVHILATKI